MRTVTFLVLEGNDKGRAFKDLPVPVTIGREEGNSIRLNDDRTSRFHAKIQFEDDDIILTDLESTNGTRINGTVIQMRRLRPGDQISIGRSTLLYGTMEEIAARRAATVRTSERPQYRPSAQDVGNVRLHQNGSQDWHDLTSSCEKLRSLLETGSVFCMDAELNGLNSAVLGNNPGVLAVLGRGFHRVVVVDSAKGIAPDNRFNSDIFLAEVCRVVGSQLGLQIDPTRFHAEDIFQILKDELPSLFCFVHFECVAADSLRTARAFTQGVHRVLFLNDGPKDMPYERSQPDSVASDTVQKASVVSEDLPPLPTKMTPAQAARFAEIFDFLHRKQTTAVENIDSNEDGTEVRIGFTEWQTLLEVQMLLAQYGRTIAEPEPD